MKFTVLMGSPRLNGNTAELCKPFVKRLEDNGAQVKYITLADKKISPCKGCYKCQNVSGEYGCAQKDDMYSVVDALVWADCIVFASPIYTWYCPTEMKAALDRLYGMNKYYGSADGSLWAGKSVAVIATHGYDAQYGAEPFITGIKRLCEHSKLIYRGFYSVRDTDDKASFQTPEAISGAEAFALRLLSVAENTEK